MRRDKLVDLGVSVACLHFAAHLNIGGNSGSSRYNGKVTSLVDCTLKQWLYRAPSTRKVLSDLNDVHLSFRCISVTKL